MAIKEDIISDISGILKQTWNDRDGQVVPTVEDVALTGGAVNLDATMLYSDLADSTELAMYNKKMAAKIYKIFLACSARIIRYHGGDIRSFDGDRIMAVFLGDYKNTNAAKCALKLKYIFLNYIKPELEKNYQVLRDGTFNLTFCSGIDTSQVMVIRSGIRNNNDLVWVGRAPNIAAKLSNIRKAPYYTYITGDVYDKLNNEAKLSSDNKQMWEKREGKDDGLPNISTLYRSSWGWVV